jgi:hypothetical protein
MADSRPTSSRLFAHVVIVVAVGFMMDVRGTAGMRSTTAISQPIALSEEANLFLRGMILLLVPSEYLDDDEWGRQRRIQSGLNVKLDGGKLHTSRRWKEVNHGVWKRTEVRLHQPEEKFQIQVEVIPQNDKALSRYRIHAAARVRVHGRQQRWSNGVKLYSASADATADVTFKAEIILQRSFVNAEGKRRLRILPHVESFLFTVNGIRLQRLGHAKGTVVREFGRSLRSTINRIISDRNPGLVAKINQKIQKKPDRFEIPLGVFSLLVGPTEEPTPVE